jgi:hypothetical protein
VNPLAERACFSQADIDRLKRRNMNLGDDDDEAEVELAVDESVILRCHWLSFLSGVHRNLAGTAVIFCRNDSVAHPQAEPTKTRSGRELALAVAPEVVDVDGIAFGDAARDNEGGCAGTAVLSTLRGPLVTVYNRKMSYDLF